MGPVFLAGLFCLPRASLDVTEALSSRKYAAYEEYQQRVSRFFPWPSTTAAGARADPIVLSAPSRHTATLPAAPAREAPALPSSEKRSRCPVVAPGWLVVLVGAAVSLQSLGLLTEATRLSLGLPSFA